MAYRQDALVINSLARRWSGTSNPAAGTTCVASSPTPQNLLSRMHADQILFSMINSTAAAVTGTLSVRNTSISGSILGQVRIQVPALSSLQDDYNINLLGKAGVSLYAEFGSPNASYTQNVTLMGWEEERA